MLLLKSKIWNIFTKIRAGGAAKAS